MLALIEQTARNLAAAGITRGDRVGILSEPRPEFSTFTLACWKIGAVVVPLSTRYPIEKLRAALRSVNCNHLFASATLCENARMSLRAKRSNPNPVSNPESDMPAIPMYVLSDYVQAADLAPITFDELALDLEADNSIIFTSGTSGQPKGVLHTLANHYYSALGSHANIAFGRGDGWLASLPMYHAGGFSLIMRALIAAGRILFPELNEPLAEAIMHPAVTHLSLVPSQLIRLLDEPTCVERLKRLQAILLGGDAIPPSLLDRACDLHLPVCITYGSTEAGSQIATSAPGRLHDGAKVLPYREVKIALDCEICIKGETLFRGYIHADTIDPARDTGSWFHTGDIGTLDEDGRLSVTGRKDLMFISGGENVYPEEIERALLSLPNIEQAVVVAVADPRFAHRPLAFVRTRNNTPVDVEQIKSELRSRLESFKVPQTFLPWPADLPDSPKPPRARLADIALHELPGL